MPKNMETTGTDGQLDNTVADRWLLDDVADKEQGKEARHERVNHELGETAVEAVERQLSDKPESNSNKVSDDIAKYVEQRDRNLAKAKERGEDYIGTRANGDAIGSIADKTAQYIKNRDANVQAAQEAGTVYRGITASGEAIPDNEEYRETEAKLKTFVPAADMVKDYLQQWDDTDSDLGILRQRNEHILGDQNGKYDDVAEYIDGRYRDAVKNGDADQARKLKTALDIARATKEVANNSTDGVLNEIIERRQKMGRRDIDRVGFRGKDAIESIADADPVDLATQILLTDAAEKANDELSRQTAETARYREQLRSHANTEEGQEKEKLRERAKRVVSRFTQSLKRRFNIGVKGGVAEESVDTSYDDKLTQMADEARRARKNGGNVPLWVAMGKSGRDKTTPNKVADRQEQIKATESNSNKVSDDIAKYVEQRDRNLAKAKERGEDYIGTRAHGDAIGSIADKTAQYIKNRDANVQAAQEAGTVYRGITASGEAIPDNFAEAKGESKPVTAEQSTANDDPSSHYDNGSVYDPDTAPDEKEDSGNGIEAEDAKVETNGEKMNDKEIFLEAGDAEDKLNQVINDWRQNLGDQLGRAVSVEEFNDKFGAAAELFNAPVDNAITLNRQGRSVLYDYIKNLPTNQEPSLDDFIDSYNSQPNQN